MEGYCMSQKRTQRAQKSNPACLLLIVLRPEHEEDAVGARGDGDVVSEVVVQQGGLSEPVVRAQHVQDDLAAVRSLRANLHLSRANKAVNNRSLSIKLCDKPCRGR